MGRLKPPKRLPINVHILSTVTDFFRKLTPVLSRTTLAFSIIQVPKIFTRTERKKFSSAFQITKYWCESEITKNVGKVQVYKKNKIFS